MNWRETFLRKWSTSSSITGPLSKPLRQTQWSNYLLEKTWSFQSEIRCRLLLAIATANGLPINNVSVSEHDGEIWVELGQVDGYGGFTVDVDGSAFAHYFPKNEPYHQWEITDGHVSINLLKGYLCTS